MPLLLVLLLLTAAGLITNASPNDEQDLDIGPVARIRVERDVSNSTAAEFNPAAILPSRVDHKMAATVELEPSLSEDSLHSARSSGSKARGKRQADGQSTNRSDVSSNDAGTATTYYYTLTDTAVESTDSETDQVQQDQSTQTVAPRTVISNLSPSSTSRPTTYNPLVYTSEKKINCPESKIQEYARCCNSPLPANLLPQSLLGRFRPPGSTGGNEYVQQYMMHKFLDPKHSGLFNTDLPAINDRLAPHACVLEDAVNHLNFIRRGPEDLSAVTQIYNQTAIELYFARNQSDAPADPQLFGDTLEGQWREFVPHFVRGCDGFMQLMYASVSHEIPVQWVVLRRSGLPDRNCSMDGLNLMQCFRLLELYSCFDYWQLITSSSPARLWCLTQDEALATCSFYQALSTKVNERPPQGRDLAAMAKQLSRLKSKLQDFATMFPSVTKTATYRK